MANVIHSIEAFNLPRTFWRDVDRYDRRINSFSKGLPVNEKLGFIAVRTRMAVWAGESDSSVVYWRSRRLGIRAASQLVIGEHLPAVRSITSAGVAAVPQADLYATSFEYTTGQGARRTVATDAGYAPATWHDSFMRGTALPVGGEDQIPPTPTQEDYEAMLGALQRGASGRYFLTEQVE